MKGRHYNTDELNKIPILEVARTLGIEVVRGKNVLCIAHQERTPSMHIYPTSNSWHCFACGKGGGVITMVRYKLNLSFQDACEWLIGHINISANYSIWRPQKKYLRSSENVYGRQKVTQEDKANRLAPDSELMEWIVDTGRLSPEARVFLFDERKYDMEIIKRQRIFSISKPEVFRKILLERFGKERCINSGLFKDYGTSIYCMWQQPCVVFPFYDIDGKLVSLQARTYTKEKKGRYIFPTGIPIRYYNMNSLKNLEEDSKVYIAEGVTDCLALLSEGMNAIAVPGARNVVLADTLPLEKFMLLMYPDDDEPGRQLFASLSEIIKRPIYRQRLPEGIGDYCDYHLSKLS